MSELSFQVEATLRAAPEDVWATIGDFGNEHRWTKTLKQCARDTPDVRVGTTRTCTLPKPLMGRTEAVETLTEYEPGQAFTYVLHGEAGPFAKAQSRWRIEPASPGSTRIVVEGRFEPKNWAARYLVWPVARPMIRRLTRSVLDELDAHVAG